jgi:probable phosphoglycerate mutase
VDRRSELWVVRHGETEWSRDHRHTSVTDLELTERGQEAALALRDRLHANGFDAVLTSPLHRARETARLAGFGNRAEVDADLHEWRYGDYEGVSTEEIRKDVPGWSVWTHQVPGGEQIEDVSRRVDRVVERARSTGRVLAFAHAHVLRVLAARWMGLDARVGANLRLDTSTVSVLGWERETPVVLRWNA